MAGHFPLGSAPIWEEDGMCIPQSSTILRGLGIRLGYYSNDSETCWNIDSLVDFCEDMMGAIPAYTAPLLSGGVPNEAIADQWVNKSWRKMVTVLEGRLAGHGKPFLAGTDRPTIADFKAFQHVTNYLKGNGCATPQPTVSRVEALIADVRSSHGGACGQGLSKGFTGFGDRGLRTTCWTIDDFFFDKL